VPRRSILSEDEATEINLSPMIDCIFILLIFFIVTTVFVEEQGLQVAKPDAAASVSLEEKQNVVLEITADGKILLGDREVGLAEIANKVKALLSDPETPVVIRAHEKAHHGTFVAVWDAARRGGAQALSFNTVN
jgi:biopolymer transport protein ExbD